MTRPDRPDPLQPVERELADALARTASAGPSAKLDATILAAARAAAAASDGGTADGHAADGSGPVGGAPPSAGAARGHHRRRRSPAWLRGGAVAATVVLAVGVAWQLRPQFEPVGVGDLSAPADVAAPAPESPPTPAPAAAAEEDARAVPAAAPELQEIAPTSAPRPRQQPLEQAGRDAPAARRAATAAEDQALPERPARKSSPAAAAELVEAAPATSADRAPVQAPMPAPSPAAALPPPPPAPPAPPAPSPAAREPTRFLQAQPPHDSRAARETTARSRSTDARAEPLRDAEDAIWFDQPVDLVPPASVDAPAVREAWLARIHELVAAERYQEARDSFAEFRRRHPDAPVPADLDMLLGDE